MRGESDDRRRTALDRIAEAFAEIASRRGVAFDCVPTHETSARQCSPWLMDRLGEAVETQGFAVRRLPSGAGHDAMAMASLTDIGMLFVRCREGISHHPAESMTAADAGVAAQILFRFLERFAPDERQGELPE